MEGFKKPYIHLDAVYAVSRQIQAVLDVDVGAGEPADDAGEPAQQRGAGAIRAHHDAVGAIEDSGAFFRWEGRILEFLLYNEMVL